MNKVRVLLFATLRDRAGMRDLLLEIPLDTDVNHLRQLLGEKVPQIRELLKNCLVAANGEYIFGFDAIPLGAEVALFPPVSGG